MRGHVPLIEAPFEYEKYSRRVSWNIFCFLFGVGGVIPLGATEWAMVMAGVILIAGELTILTKGRIVKIISVTIEAIFDEILVIFDAVLLAEVFSLDPSSGFNLDKLDIC